MLNRRKSKSSWKQHINQVAYKLIPNEPRINVHNTLEHELAKCIWCYNLKKAGKICYCELILKNGGRLDLFIPELETGYEFLCSETIEQFNKKRTKYPEEWNIIPLKVDEVIKDG